MPLFSGIKSIQTFATSGGPVTISAVNVNKTIINYNGVTVGSASDVRNANAAVILTSSTQVSVTQSNSGSVLYGSVLEYY